MRVIARVLWLISIKSRRITEPLNKRMSLHSTKKRTIFWHGHRCSATCFTSKISFKSWISSPCPTSRFGRIRYARRGAKKSPKSVVAMEYSSRFRSMNSAERDIASSGVRRFGAKCRNNNPNLRVKSTAVMPKFSSIRRVGFRVHRRARPSTSKKPTCCYKPSKYGSLAHSGFAIGSRI